MEMLPERTAACSSVGASGCIALCALSTSSPRLAQLTAPTHITCREPPTLSAFEQHSMGAQIPVQACTPSMPAVVRCRSSVWHITTGPGQCAACLAKLSS